MTTTLSLFFLYSFLGGSSKVKEKRVSDCWEDFLPFRCLSKLDSQRGKNITLNSSISFAEIKLWVIYTRCPVVTLRTHLLPLKKKNHCQSYCSCDDVMCQSYIYKYFCFNWMQNESLITGFKTKLLKNWLLRFTIEISGLLMFPFWQEQPLICCTTHKAEVELPLVSLDLLHQTNWNFLLVWNTFFFTLGVVVLQRSSHFSVFLRKWTLWKNTSLKARPHGTFKARHALEDPEGTKWGDMDYAGCACLYHKHTSPPQL